MIGLTVAASLTGLLAPRSWAAAPVSDDRIALSLNGSTLTGTNGGGGGSLGWLHNFTPDALLGIAAEHQVLASSHWTFGSVTGAYTLGSPDQRFTFAGEAHEGAGDDGPRAFTYRVEALSVTGTWFRRLSVVAEDRQVDVETTHGNLPRLGVSYLWNPHIQTAVAYQYSVTGNLGTRLTSARIDVYGPAVNFIAGGAWGQASPTILGLGFVLPPRHLSEGYVGLSKPLPWLRSELTLIADYLQLSGGTGIEAGNAGPFDVPRSNKATLTLNYVFHPHAPRSSP
ncbi:MAG TPA: hypothetical protein VMT29_20925 [Steroidobacteraceae bacterium]|nr:hypothetical protein [Steroidobacteraceae bacterium]